MKMLLVNEMIRSEKYPNIKWGIKMADANIGYADNKLTVPWFCAFLLDRHLGADSKTADSHEVCPGLNFSYAGDAAKLRDEIRRTMRARRKAVTPAARAAAGTVLSKRLFITDRNLGKAISKKGPIAVYLASKEEIDLTDFISAALSFGCVLVAPRWNGTEYELVRIENLDSLVKGPHGILEPPAGPVIRPEDVRAWLVPGLAFTKNGGRLGYGGGWYDRLLCKVPKRVPKIGIAYTFQLVDELPTEPHDIRLTSVVSCDDSGIGA